MTVTYQDILYVFNVKENVLKEPYFRPSGARSRAIYRPMGLPDRIRDRRLLMSIMSDQSKYIYI